MSKRLSSYRERVNLERLLNLQENAIKSIADELNTLEWCISIKQEEKTAEKPLNRVFYSDANPCKQAKLYRRLLFSFPLRKISQHFDGFYLSCEVLKNITYCFTMEEEINKSDDLLADSAVYHSIRSSECMLAMALSNIIEIKKLNGII